MPRFSRRLTRKNIDQVLRRYVESASRVGASVAGLRGLPLLDALKRTATRAGPYRKVSIFEAANRIMSDLVILYGVRCLLRTNVFPFTLYRIDYGHHNKQAHDIMASARSRSLFGEAFNVAPTFFQTKKTATLKKLRKAQADYKLVVFNHDAIDARYAPQPRKNEYFVVVNIKTKRCQIFSG